MTTESLGDVNRRIGALEGAVTALTNNWERQDQRAELRIEKIYQGVEELNKNFAVFIMKISRLEIQVSDLEKFEREQTTANDLAQGSKKTLAALWTGAAAIGGLLVEVLSRFVWPRH